MKKNQNKSELEGIFWFAFVIIAITIIHVNRWNLEGYWELILYGVILIIFAIGIYKAMENATEFTKHNIRKIQSNRKPRVWVKGYTRNNKFIEGYWKNNPD